MTWPIVSPRKYETASTKLNGGVSRKRRWPSGSAISTVPMADLLMAPFIVIRKSFFIANFALVALVFWVHQMLIKKKNEQAAIRPGIDDIKGSLLNVYPLQLSSNLVTYYSEDR